MKREILLLHIGACVQKIEIMFIKIYSKSSRANARVTLLVIYSGRCGALPIHIDGQIEKVYSNLIWLKDGHLI